MSDGGAPPGAPQGPDESPGPGYWKASDGNWYPPDAGASGEEPPGAGYWKASDGNWYPPERAAAQSRPVAEQSPGSPSASKRAPLAVLGIAAVVIVVAWLIATRSGGNSDRSTTAPAAPGGGADSSDGFDVLGGEDGSPQAPGQSADAGNQVDLALPAGRGEAGSFSLHFDDIWSLLTNNTITSCIEPGLVPINNCAARWEMELVFGTTGDVGGTITHGQFCYITFDGQVLGFAARGGACQGPVELGHRVEADTGFVKRVAGDGLSGGVAVVYAYWGIDDSGNDFYLERALSAHNVSTGLDIVERDRAWLDDLPQQAWRDAEYLESRAEAAQGAVEALDDLEELARDTLEGFLGEGFLDTAGGGDTGGASSAGQATTPAEPDVGLHDSEVLDLWWGALGSIYSVPAGQRDLVNEQVAAAMASGQQVLECSYGPSDPVQGTGFTSYRFWYRDGPDDLDSMLAAVAAHPFSLLGVNPATECPDSRDMAQQLRQAGG